MDAVVTDAKKAMADVAALVDSANFSHLQQQQTSRIGACLSAPATVLTFIRGSFRPGPVFVSGGDDDDDNPAQQQIGVAAPHLIMMYCALLALAILWDDYSLLDRASLAHKVGSCQGKDRGFATLPGADNTDLRMTYCAFLVCALVDNWSCINLPRAFSYIQRYRVRSLSPRRLAPPPPAVVRVPALKAKYLAVFLYESGFLALAKAAKDVGASQGALVDLFDRIETFFQRLEIYINIMAEILGILAIATKEIRQGWGKRYLKKLTGKTDIEDALTRLEKLSNDEALTATVQVLEAADSMDGKMEQVVDVTQQIESRVGDLKRDHLQANLQMWLSPPDPSINYNTARDAYHNGTATWFTRGHTYQDWKTSGSGSLFWVHGKAGSGKTILSSAIVDDFKQSLDTRPSHMVYFFFDFKDAAKQDIHALQTSLLVQLCRQSNLCFKALFDLYSTHDKGEQQPSESALSYCLRAMFRVLGQVPIYLIIDALDECPNTSKSIGAPRSRQKVLEFLKELVELHLPNLHICVTSRPELDIQNTFQQLAHLKISLHDEDGQKQDIAEYVHSVIYSDNELVMKKWRQEIKDLVIKALSEKADGMFRWVVCQLETLRECLARNVERVLSELPESLDETYLCVLKGVKSANRGDVYRLLQCLVVAVRPLRVDELAEVLAMNFDGDDGTPQLNPDWQWEDQEEALQAACSSLITIVDTGKSRVVQFSHFSVKEFLTSPCLADSSADVSRYHISLESAHTILAQSCLGVLMHLPVREDLYTEKNDGSDSEDNVDDRFPLAMYATRYWVNHVQYKNVSSRVSEGVELLFDPNKLHFSTWLQYHDMDTSPNNKSFLSVFALEQRPKNGSCLYYTALCGLYGLVEHLIVKHHQDVNARGGYYVAPMGAALAGKHLHVAKLLYQHGANVDVPGEGEKTLLQMESVGGEPEMVQWLLECGAETNAQETKGGAVALHFATLSGNLETVQILVQHNADINAKTFAGHTPLHLASESCHLDVVRFLLVSSTDVNAWMEDGYTPLHMVSRRDEHLDLLLWGIQEGKVAIARLLLENGADIRVVDNIGRTAFCCNIDYDVRGTTADIENE
ncbi:hypothetical protein BGW80DRAFT_1467116 [Lactifluus volemus]|nr:hypothetical protein BGW80DRAFT_1467116 [Lactifluus volemus]